MSASSGRTNAHRRWRLPISGKLLVASVMVGSIVAGVAINGLHRVHLLNQSLGQALDDAAEKAKLAALLKQDLFMITRAEKSLILATTVEDMQRFAASIDETLAVMQQHQDQLRRLADEDRHLHEAFERKWLEWQQVHREIRSLAQLNTVARARQLALGKSRESFERLEQALSAVAAKIASEAELAQGEGRDVQLENLLRKMGMVSLLMADAARIQKAEKQLILATSEEEMLQYEQALIPLPGEIESQFGQLDDLADETERQALAEARQAFKTYVDVLTEIRTVLNQRGAFVMYELARELGGPLTNDCEILLEQIQRNNEANLEVSRARSRRAYVTTRTELLWASAIGIVVAVGATYLTGRYIVRNLMRLAEYTRELRQTGDLSRPVPAVSQDEVGLLAETFDQLRLSLHRQTSELAEVNRALQQKTTEMEQFVYTVSHDLSSPLVSCKGLAGLIREDAETGNLPEVKQSAHKLGTAVEQLRRIISDLLTLSRIGRKPLRLADVDVPSLLEDLRGELSMRFRDVGAEIRLDETIPHVIADPTDLRRVFENLLINALNYGCDGDGAVVMVGGCTADGETRFFVRDNGPGIAPQDHQRIFALFQRLDSERPGTGVGLASVAKIMQVHGGRVWIESTEGKGATFWLAFPHQPMPAANASLIST